MQDSGRALSDMLLERLQDIHGAAEPSWWPPAPGWWVVAGVALAAAVFGLVVLWRAVRVRLRRRRLMRELDELARAYDPAERPADYIAAINRWFRGVALRAFPDSDCARLQGAAWVEFIRARLPRVPEAAALDALVDGPYRPDPEFDPAALKGLARKWLTAHG